MTFCYSLSISYDLALEKLEQLTIEEHPMISLYYASVLLMKSNSFKTKEKLLYLNKSFYWFNRYYAERKEENSFETTYNSGRYYQFIGNERKAEEMYDKLVVNYFHNLAFNGSVDVKKEELFQATVYNKAVKEIKNGNGAKAAKLLRDNIFI